MSFNRCMIIIIIATWNTAISPSKSSSVGCLGFLPSLMSPVSELEEDRDVDGGVLEGDEDGAEYCLSGLRNSQSE